MTPRSATEFGSAAAIKASTDVRGLLTPKLQVNGSAGVTFNFENTETDYKSGDEFQFERAFGRQFATGLVIGIVGWDLLVTTIGSSPAIRVPAALAPSRGRIDAIWLSVSCTTLINKRPLVVNPRQ